MMPLIYEIFVLTYYNLDERETQLFNEQVYMDKKPAMKAMYYQNSKPPMKANGLKPPRVSVHTVEEYIKIREREAYTRGEIYGEHIADRQF